MELIKATFLLRKIPFKFATDQKHSKKPIIELI